MVGQKKTFGWTIFLLWAIIMSSPCLVSAQKPKTKQVSIDYQYVAGNDMSVEMAKAIALQRAQVQAIADEFGTIITQTATTYVTNTQTDGTAAGQTSMSALGSSDVKGEWLETTDVKYHITYDETLGTVVNVSLKGVIRELVTSSIELSTKILRNGTTSKFESSAFNNGDDLYMLFQSPVRGYLAVYLTDADNAYCLLPYQNQRVGAVSIDANREYLFFSVQQADEAVKHLVDEYQLTCEQRQEINRIYVIFSPNEFAKAVDNAGGVAAGNNQDVLPRQLPLRDFQRWLSRTRAHDTKMVLQAMDVTINN